MTKFYVHRTQTIMSGLVIRWSPAGNINAEISASRDAVCVSGYWDLHSPTQIAEFRTVLAHAEEARHLLARGLLGKPPRYENELDFHFGDTLADVVAKHELAAGVHPASWLDCPACRARSKSGAEPPRCDVFIANERAAKEQAGG